jgi:N-acetylglucosamine-6-sulfatase
LPGYYTSVVTDLALDWLKTRQTDKPWLLCVGHKAPHSFYTPEPKYEHAFDDVQIAYPESAFHLQDKPAWMKQRLTTWHGIYGPLFSFRKNFPDERPEGVKDFAAMIRSYWATILSVDDSVGRMLEHLRAAGQLDNTIIMLLGDNGLLNGEHGMVDKRAMQEPSIRIPLVVRYPGLTREPKVIEQQTLTIDLAPSVLELCGAGPMPGVQGRSWVRLVAGADSSWRRSWLYEYNYEREFPFTPNVRGVRCSTAQHGDWKYIHYPHGDGSPDQYRAELYDLTADPAENKNLANDPAYTAALLRMQGELMHAMAGAGLAPPDDKMPLDEGIKQELPDLKTR